MLILCCSLVPSHKASFFRTIYCQTNLHPSNYYLLIQYIRRYTPQQANAVTTGVIYILSILTHISIEKIIVSRTKRRVFRLRTTVCQRHPSYEKLNYN